MDSELKSIIGTFYSTLSFNFVFILITLNVLTFSPKVFMNHSEISETLVIGPDISEPNVSFEAHFSLGLEI